MATDRNKKSLRTFQCRDYLWEYFEQMASELECSVDYLVNEAMRQYARARVQAAKGGSQAGKRPTSGQRQLGSSSGSIPSIRTTGSGSHAGATTGSGSHASIPPPPSGSQAGQAPGQGSSSGAFASPPQPPVPQPPQAQAPPPPPPQAPATPQAPPPPPPPSSAGDSEVTPRPSAPPPLPGQRPDAAPAPPDATAQRPPLQLIYNGERIPIDKDEFVIGRGAKHADLAIRDGNISRRHAAIVFQDGQFFMKDLGSTNGIEYGGQRVEARRIDEGDVFHLCDYELRFTYR